MMTAEFKLALACCRWSYSGDRGDEVVHLASQIDWPRFVDLIRRHRVQGLVAQALLKNHIPVPEATAESIRSDAAAIAEQNLRSARECLLLRDRFAAAGTALLFVKGLSLSALAYGDAYVKMSSDIDILVDAGSVESAANLLSDSGFRPIVPAGEFHPSRIARWHGQNKESAWHNPESDLIVELHTRLSDNAALIPAIGMSSERQDVNVGAGHSLPTLTTGDLFAYLCVHGSSSAWFRMKWIADLAAFLHSAGQGETERLYRHAEDAGAGRAPAQALLLADRLSLLELPPALRTELRADKVNRLLAGAAFGLLTNARAPTERRLGTLPIHWTQPLLLRGWPFKLSETRRQVKEALQRAG